MPNQIRSATLTGYAEVAEAVGLDADAMLASVGLSPTALRDPDGMIPADAVGRLLERSARDAGVDDFGLRMVQSRRLSTLGPIGLLAAQASTLRGLLTAVVRYLRLHNESLRLRIDESDGVVVLALALDTRRPAARVRQAIELSVGALHRIVGSLLGDAWRPLQVCFTHGPPRGGVRTHRRVFGASARLEFDAAFDGVVCRVADLDRPIPAADPALARYARDYLDGLARGADGESLPAQVRQLVRALIPTGRCTVDRVAESLGVDRRTVHRHLAREGTSFTRVLADARRDMAERYVAQAARPLSDVAELLGFASQSAFGAWFRAQYGCTAGAWRAAHGAAPARRVSPGRRGPRPPRTARPPPSRRRCTS